MENGTTSGRNPPWNELSQYEQKTWMEQASILIQRGYVDTNDVETVAQFVYRGHLLTKTE